MTYIIMNNTGFNQKYKITHDIGTMWVWYDIRGAWWVELWNMDGDQRDENVVDVKMSVPHLRRRNRTT